MPLTAAVAAGGARLSRHGRAFDCMGDVAANDGDSAHQRPDASVPHPPRDRRRDDERPG